MCSACTSSSPSAVNSAAEQSARSLMFGLYAARRSTAPISSAIDRRAARSRTCSAAGFTSRSHHPRAERGPARRAQPSGTHTVQSGSATTAGPDDRGARRRRAGRRRSSGAAARDARPQRDDLDRRARARVAVAPLVLGGELVDVAARSARGSGPRSGSRRQLVDVATPATQRADRARRSAARASSRPSRDAGRRPRPHELALLGATTASPTAENTPARGGTIDRAHPERVGDRARVQRPGAAERDEREVARVDALLDASPRAPPAPSPRRRPRPRPSAVTPARVERGARPRRRRGGRAREARCRRGCARARGRRR